MTAVYQAQGPEAAAVVRCATLHSAIGSSLCATAANQPDAGTSETTGWSDAGKLGKWQLQRLVQISHVKLAYMAKFS